MHPAQEFIRDNKELFIDLSSVVYYSDLLEAKIKETSDDEKVKLDNARKNYYAKHSLI